MSNAPRADVQLLREPVLTAEKALIVLQTPGRASRYTRAGHHSIRHGRNRGGFSRNPEPS